MQSPATSCSEPRAKQETAHRTLIGALWAVAQGRDTTNRIVSVRPLSSVNLGSDPPIGSDSLQFVAGLRVRDRGGGKLAPQRRLLAREPLEMPIASSIS